MKQHQQTILTVFFIIVLAAYAGRSYIRNWFPTKMKFAATALTTIDTKLPITINDLKGNVVIVSCYQTWCIDCARETPNLNQLATALNSAKFKIIYISDEDTGLVNLFRHRFPSGNIMFTKFDSSLASLGISAFPTTFLLNKNGSVVKTKSGGYDWLSEKATIEKLLAE